MDLFSGKLLNNDAQGDAFDIRNYWHPTPHELKLKEGVHLRNRRGQILSEEFNENTNSIVKLLLVCRDLLGMFSYRIA